MAKKIILCDTDVMIDYWNTNQARNEATKRILEIEIGLDNVALAAITKLELLAGAGNNKDLVLINRKLNRFNIALLSNGITIKAFDLMLKYRLSHGMALPDCLIAATALENTIELFTYNSKDFKFIANLKLYK
jgi:predicted nucleic acid-binding protein